MELKTYMEWVPILEKEYKCIVYDDNGPRYLAIQNRFNEKMVKEEALKYFNMNTMVFKIRIKIKNKS